MKNKKFCSHCGEKLTPLSKFCGNCGVVTGNVEIVEEEKTKDNAKYYPLEALCVPDSELPEGVDPLRREFYLSPEDFFENFNMDLEKFCSIKERFKKRYKDFIFDDWRYYLPKIK